MNARWKVLIVVVLAVAAFAIISSKQRTARTPAAEKTAPTSRPQFIELGSKMCIPCQKMAPIIEELRAEYKGQLEVTFWDVYEHPEKAKGYHVRVIPTQLLIGADGKEFFRHEGFFPKKDILAKFKEHGIALGGKR